VSDIDWWGHDLQDLRYAKDVRGHRHQEEEPVSNETRDKWCRLLYWLGTLGKLDPDTQAEFDATYPGARVSTV